MSTPDEHTPTLVHFDSRHSIPAEVCWECSDEQEGRWVPVTECPQAAAQMGEPGSLNPNVVHITRDRKEYT